MKINVRKTSKVDNVQKLQTILDELHNKKIQIGLFSEQGDFLLMIARVHEFGTTITPKNAKALTVPLIPEALGHRAREIGGLFLHKVGNQAYLCKKEGSGLKYYYWLAKQVTIPERPFIRGTYDNRKSEMQNFIKENLSLLFSFQMTVDSFLNKVGEYLVQLTKDYITDLEQPEKSQITIAAEGGATSPLIYTGKMRDSITFKIV